VTKVAKILDMMKRAGGATLAELMFATGWQSHSIRAFVSTLSKRDKIRIRSMRNPKGERVYEILD
jgi:DNA-binding IclR family transcriptional regulator